MLLSIDIIRPGTTPLRDGSSKQIDAIDTSTIVLFSKIASLLFFKSNA